MNLAGMAVGFIAATLLGFLGTWVVLGVYESWRRDIGSLNPEMVQGQILKMAAIVGVVFGVIAAGLFVF